jgi:hypothetical protein
MTSDATTNDGSEQELTPDRVRSKTGFMLEGVEDGVGYCQIAAENLEWIREEIAELDALLPERGEGGESRTAIEHNIEGPAATGPRRGDILMNMNTVSDEPADVDDTDYDVATNDEGSEQGLTPERTRSIIGRITGYLDDGLAVAHGIVEHFEYIRDEVADIEALLPEEP